MIDLIQKSADLKTLPRAPNRLARLRGATQPLTPCHGFQVLDDGHCPQIEQILPEAAIASARPLAIGEVSERVLDSNTLS